MESSNTNVTTKTEVQNTSTIKPTSNTIIKKSYAVMLRKVFNLIETNPKTCYVGPLYSNQLYEFTLKSGEKLYGYVDSLDEVLKTYPRDILVDYSITLTPVIDELTNKFDYAGYTVKMSNVASVVKKHPLFSDFGAGIEINPSMLREYAVFSVVLNGIRHDISSYALQKFVVKNRPGSIIYGYLKATNMVGKDVRLIVDAIRFYHGAIQRHDLYINLFDLTDIVRQKIVIEEFMNPTPLKHEKAWKKQENTEENSTEQSSDSDPVVMKVNEDSDPCGNDPDDTKENSVKE